MSDHERDDRLLRRLYKEPGADVDDADLAREVASLERLRGVFHDYARATEVEPPSRGLDELMAAARARTATTRAVTTTGEHASVWSRLRAWFAPIVAHPALASAMVLVLVGGVAGTLYLRGRAGPTEAVAPVDTGTVADVAIARPSATAPARDELARAPVATLDGETEDAFQVKGGEPDPAPPRERRGVKKTGGKGDAAGAGAANEQGAKAGADTMTGSNEGRLALEIRKGDKTTEHFSADRPTGVAVGGGTIEESPPPPADEAPEPRPATPSTRAGDRDDRASAGIENLTRQAKQLARDRRCVDVKKIGERVRSEDARYYRATFATDIDIKKCL